MYPNALDRPNHGTFTLNSLTLSQTLFTANIPKNYVAPFSVTVSAGPGTTGTNVHLRYVAADQPFQTLPTGIQVTLPLATTIASGTSHQFAIQFAGNSSAATWVSLYLGFSATKLGLNRSA